MHRVFDVLTYIQQSVSDAGRVKRLKLLYYAQAWNLVWRGEPLYAENIKAWEMGPVVPQAFHYDRDTASEDPGDPKDLDDASRAVVDAVITYYGDHDGGQLSELTHQEEPWVSARNRGLAVGDKSPLIPRETIRDYYEQQELLGKPGPEAPVVTAPMPAPRITDLVRDQLDRWAGANALLAER